MPSRPDVPYSPVQSVVPDVQQPNDAIHAEATPQDFGSQVAAAGEQLGQTGQKLGDEATSVALEQQGMVNQSLAQNAETDYVTKLSAITDGYKSLEGLDAVNAKPQITAQIAALKQQTLANIPTGGAQRAFAQLAQRHEANALMDAGSYYTSQIKAGLVNSSHAMTANAINQAGSFSVASDDSRFNYSLQTANVGLNDMMKTQGYGSVMTVDPKTGAASFDTSTPQGQQAQQVYTDQHDALIGKAWTSRIHALADDPQSGNPANAFAVFQQNRSQIPPEAQNEIAAYLNPKMKAIGANNTARDALATLDAGYQQSIGQGGAGNVADAIHGAESGGRSTSPTSVNNAQGGWQVTPGTFAQYAKPGESIAVPADNEAVGRRIVADLQQKFGNDPARVAVGYFSGPGNVAPAGSLTPWVSNKVDGNGTSVSSYVSSVLGRMGNAPASAPPVPGAAPSAAPVNSPPIVPGAPPGLQPIQTKADYYRAHYLDTVASTTAQAQAAHPDDPYAVQQVVARVTQQMDATIRQQDMNYKADSDMIWQAANGDLAKGTKPMTVDQLTATNPDVKAAWGRMQYQQPLVAHEVATRLLSENAQTNGGDTKTYGAGFISVFNRIHAAEGDPNKISDPTQLYGMVGQPGGLTMSGLEKARAEIGGKGTPDGEAESNMRNTFFKVAHAALSGTDDGMGLKDPKGEQIYLRFMAHAYSAIDAAKATGKTPAQIYSPDSPDYVGQSLAPGAGFRRTLAQRTADMVSENDTGATAKPAAQSSWLGGLFSPAKPFDASKFDLTKSEGIVAAYRAGMSRSDAEAAAAKLGYTPDPQQQASR